MFHSQCFTAAKSVVYATLINNHMIVKCPFAPGEIFNKRGTLKYRDIFLFHAPSSVNNEPIRVPL